MPPDSPAVLSGERRPVFPTANVRDAELSGIVGAEENREAWDRAIDGRLVEWGRDPGALVDDDFDPPDPRVINLACHVAMCMRDRGDPSPTKVVPDGEGGIAFEYVEGTASWSLEIYSDLTVEVLVFDDCRLAERRVLI